MSTNPVALIVCAALAMCMTWQQASAQSSAETMSATAAAHCESEGKQFVLINTFTGMTPKSSDVATLAVSGQCVSPGDPGYDAFKPHGPLIRGAVSGTEQHIDFVYDINPDCTTAGVPVVRAKTAPAHGTVRIENGEDFTTFRSDNQRYACNLKKSPGVLIYYTSDKTYFGTDEFDISIIFPHGSTRVEHYKVLVQ